MYIAYHVYFSNNMLMNIFTLQKLALLFEGQARNIHSVYSKPCVSVIYEDLRLHKSTIYI